jgi:hypothetical protein
MLLNVTCKKCGLKYRIDIGDKTIDQVKETMKKQDTFSCPGHHIELSSPLNFLVFGEIEDGRALSDPEWLNQKKKEGFTLMNSDEVREKYTCTGFSCGLYCGKNKKTGESVVLDFMNSPAGVRYYF